MDSGAGARLFCALMGVILVIGLFPDLGYTAAYADEDDSGSSSNAAVLSAGDSQEATLDNPSGESGQSADAVGVTGSAAGAQTLGAEPGEGVAFAVFSLDEGQVAGRNATGSLTLYYDAAENVPSAGDTYPEGTGRTVTAVYTDLEDTSYAYGTGYGAGAPWSDYNQNSFGYNPVGRVTSVTTDESFANARPVSTAYWFYDIPACTSIDLAYLCTSDVESMKGMFDYCSALTSLDLSGFDTALVADMSNMFDSCNSLTSLDLSGFDTSSVEDTASMFYGCTALASLDLGENFDTGSVEDMSFMFFECRSLASLDLASFDTRGVTSFRNMFNDCEGLTFLNVSGFDTGAAENMYGMFEDCYSLVSLDLSSFDTENVTNCANFLVDEDASVEWDLEYVTIGDAFDLFGKSETAITSIQTWYDLPGDVVSSNYLIGVADAGTYYTYPHAVLTEDMFEVDTESVVYMGEAFEPAVESDLALGVDYAVEYADNVDAGTGIITITGLAPNYAGTLVYEFAIEPAAATITCADASKAYGGDDPVLTGSVEGLVDEGDLGEISYVRDPGEDAGEYAITAEYLPNANYDVTVVPGTFTITAAQISEAMFDVDTTYGVYDGSTPVTKDIDSDLVEGVDYTVAYADNDKAGEATIAITGIGNYEGTLIYTFKVINRFEDV